MEKHYFVKIEDVLYKEITRTQYEELADVLSNSRDIEEDGQAYRSGYVQEVHYKVCSMLTITLRVESFRR